MGKLVLLSLMHGSFEEGFPIEVNILDEDSRNILNIVHGKLAANTELENKYLGWQIPYRKLVDGRQSSRMPMIGIPDKELKNDKAKLISEINTANQELDRAINDWLKREGEFSIICREIDRTLRNEQEEIRFIVNTKNSGLQKIPFCLWKDFFYHYHRAEAGLYLPVKNSTENNNNDKVKILVVFGSKEFIGNNTRIRIDNDWEIIKNHLSQESNAELIRLQEPTLDEFADSMEEYCPQILFFAGHSFTDEDLTEGQIQLNQQDYITIEDLKYELIKAAKKGLKLAIFNSCDGMGIARQLQDIGISNIIVMREPVPDEVAHRFLRRFLERFAFGKSINLAVRRGREKLQRLERYYPGVVCLPVIWQNPGEPPLTWEQLGGIITNKNKNNQNSVIWQSTVIHNSNISESSSEPEKNNSTTISPNSSESSNEIQNSNISESSSEPEKNNNITVNPNSSESSNEIHNSNISESSSEPEKNNNINVNPNSSESSTVIQNSNTSESSSESEKNNNITVNPNLSESSNEIQNSNISESSSEPEKNNNITVNPNSSIWQSTVIQNSNISESPPESEENNNNSVGQNSLELVGKTIAKRYKIIKLLSRGSLGKTYLAIDICLPPDNKCVVKHFLLKSSDYNINNIAQRLFKSEALSWSKLGENNCIPRIHSYFSESRDFYLVQEFIDGENLTSEFQPGYEWSETKTINFLRELLKILDYVHQENIIHRNINPGNIMRYNSDGKLVLIDFGSFKEIFTVDKKGQRNIPNSTVSVDSLHYKPMEQLRGKPGKYSDVYAVGMLGIQALTGLTPVDLPHELDKFKQILKEQQIEISPKLESVLSRMICYHPKGRYADATEALKAITAINIDSRKTFSNKFYIIKKPLIFSISMIILISAASYVTDIIISNKIKLVPYYLPKEIQINSPEK